MHTKTKSQAALEFLTTYAWAFLVIIITIATLAYFGVLSPKKLLPDRCTFGAEFQCLAYKISATDNILEVRLKNNVGGQIKVESMALTSEGPTSFSCATSPMEYTRQLWSSSSYWSSFDINSFSDNLVNNGNTGDLSHHTDNADVGAWIMINVGAGNEREFSKIRYWASGTYTAIWDIQYSDDGINWNTAFSGWNSGASADSSIEFGNFGEHRYWRLYKTNPAVGGAWQHEIQFYEGTAYSLATWEPDKMLDLKWSNCNSEASGMIPREKGKVFVTINYRVGRAGTAYTKQAAGEIFSTVT